ncbi:MAG TPA: S-layer homology domain-containing protein [Anaerolineales bacterium]
MKHKPVLLLVAVSLMIVSFGTVQAQGSAPPSVSNNPAARPKSAVAMPTIGQWGVQDGGLKSTITSHTTTPFVHNGDFELGPGAGWGEDSNYFETNILDSTSVPVPPHSGNWIAWLGGEDGERALLYQPNINIVNPTYLRVWYWIGSEDICFQDTGVVAVNAAEIFSWTLCENNNTSGWVPLDLNLSAYDGQAVNLLFQVVTDGQRNSNLFLDDVSLYPIFADVSFQYWAESFVQRLSKAGITGGCGSNPPLYCPEGTVTRAQMAVFLERGIHGSSYSPAAPGTSTGFSDVPVTYWAAPWIKQLAADGITGGCGAGTYCPEGAVTRAQMAVFLLRSKHGAAYTPPAVGASTGFSDVPTTYWAAAWIKQLVAEGITSGCGTSTYCPEAPVTRAQMAVFLVKTFNLP